MHRHSRKPTEEVDPARNRRRLRVVAPWAALALLLGAASTEPADTLFVSSFFPGAILRFNLPGINPTTIVSGLDFPEDGDCGPDDRIYFAESLASRVTRWNQDGTGRTPILSPGAPAECPEGLDFDAAGNLLLNTRQEATPNCPNGAWMLPGANPANPLVAMAPRFAATETEGTAIVLGGPHRGALLLAGERKIFISDPPGSPVRTFIDANPLLPSDQVIYGLVTTGSGEIFASSSNALLAGGGRIDRFDPEGVFLETYASQTTASFAYLDFDSECNLYVADLGGAVWQVATDRTTTLFASVTGLPLGVAICRDRAIPNCPQVLSCNAGGPYTAACTPPAACVTLDASRSSGAGPLTLQWTSDCPGATLDDPRSPTPRLCFEPDACVSRCTATLTVTSGADSASCVAAVTAEDRDPPIVTRCALTPVPPDAPRSPRSPNAASSAASQVFLRVDCGAAGDCSRFSLSPSLTVVRRDRGPSGCVESRTVAPVRCGDLLEFHRLPSPCALPRPRPPRPPVSVRSDGTRVVAGERLRLEVHTSDTCGNGGLGCAAEFE